MTDWVTLAIDQEVRWVGTEREIEFRERRLVLRPAEGERFGDVSVVRLAGESYFEAGTLLRRFLSVQAWRHQGPYREVGQTGGTHRIRIGGRRRETQLKPWPNVGFADLPFRTNTTQVLGLALYRDALGLAPNEPYKFLALFRILNITLPDARAQEDWINTHLDEIQPGRQRVETLRTEKGDVGRYLYAAGRSALAHAFRPPLFDPDQFDDTYRINLDSPLVEDLVKLFMQRELGLPPR